MSLIDYFRTNMRRKLLLFNILMVALTTIPLFSFLLLNFQEITEFSLQQNKVGMESTVEDYLTKYTQEKAIVTWLQINSAQDHLAILGRTAQKILDNYDEIQANPSILDLSLFRTDLTESEGALTSSATASVDAFIPPSLADNPKAKELLKTSGLLNLNMDAVFETNDNSAFVYFVGNPDLPVTRAYPNIHLVEAMGEDRDLLFWKDFFATNVPNWQRWFTDPALQVRVPNPITMEPPYRDAAGQGLILTMFYPLWDSQAQQFAGAVGADITLNSIIENVLSITVARSGFAFLINGSGELIAMPLAGQNLFDIKLSATELGGLSYYTGSLADSGNPSVQELSQAVANEREGIVRFDPSNGTDPNANIHRVTFTHLPAFSNSRYEADSWTVAIAVPEAEIFEVLTQTDQAIQAERARLRNISLALLVVFLAGAVIVSMRSSESITRDVRTLALAAEQVSAKNYDIDMHLQSRDEIGQLGRTFAGMAAEIRDYTTNLEERIAERTVDLQQANEQITQLNEKLQDENLRLSAELDVARQLQMMVLPSQKETDAILDLDIAGYMRPADEVGGDYYDIVSVGDVVYLGIGDVTGHGLPAGVIMLMAQTAMLTLSQSGEQDMKRMLSLLNQVLYRNILRIKENKNMTLAIIRYENRRFDLVGQHESVLICRSNGQIEEIDTLDMGFPMGLEYDIDDFITTDHFHLEPDDVLLLYTDGVTEAENVQDKQFGMEKLKESLASHHRMAAQEMVAQIMQDVHDFIGKQDIYDDISALVIKQK